MLWIQFHHNLILTFELFDNYKIKQSLRIKHNMPWIAVIFQLRYILRMGVACHHGKLYVHNESMYAWNPWIYLYYALINVRKYFSLIFPGSYSFCVFGFLYQFATWYRLLIFISIIEVLKSISNLSKLLIAHDDLKLFH